jgi:GMP synthase-like glutamine amidotransferase
MHLHYLQHVAFEPPAAILDWALARGCTVDATRLYEEEPLPSPDAYDTLVIMGGPMNVYEYEAYPWLPDEHACIRTAVLAGKTVLGVCLGAQLIAAAMGGRVSRAPTPEIGIFPVTETSACAGSPFAGFLGGAMDVLHWHGDTFSLPPGATHLARSSACAHQAFCLGPRVLGLQFHLECAAAQCRRLIEHAGESLVPGTWVQSAAAMLAEPSRFAAMNAALGRLLDRLHDARGQ